MVRNLFYSLVFTLCFVGCAKDSETRTHLVKTNDDIEEKLSSVSLSKSLSLSDKINSCDDIKASEQLDMDDELVTDKAEEIWSKCQELYACSPTTSNVLKGFFGRQKTFRVGFTDLKSIGVSRLGSEVQGITICGTDRIYLDVTLRSPRQYCHILLHELVHRFDDSGSTEESLEKEYDAYWHQVAFIEELFLRKGPLREKMRTNKDDGSDFLDEDDSDAQASKDSKEIYLERYFTRESLLKKIAETYHFKYNKALLNKYPKLPKERALERAKRKMLSESPLLAE